MHKEEPTKAFEYVVGGAQPMPTGDGDPIHDMVARDIMARKDVGTERYGMPLIAQNGRDQLLDAYEESLDLAVYIRGEFERRKIINDAILDVIRIWFTYEIKDWHTRPEDCLISLVGTLGEAMEKLRNAYDPRLFKNKMG